MPDTIDNARIDALCPELRRILDAELAAGNRVVDAFAGWGHCVMLAGPFRVAHPIEGTRVTYHELNDPHYWKAEYRVKELNQFVACRFAPDGP